MILEQTANTTLYVDRNSDLVRYYHDTGAKRTRPLGPKRKVSHNRSLEAAIALRARQANDQPSFRGSAPALPPFLARAREQAHAATSIADLASRCGVKTNTAWCYLTQLVETLPIHEAKAIARRMIASQTMASLLALHDISGTLTDVVARCVSPPLPDDVCMAEVRLARVLLRRLAP